MTGKNPWCVPDEVSAIQLLRIFHKYVKDHPEELHLSREVIVVKALMNAFCKTTPR